MSNENNTTPWQERFGTLVDVTERTSAKDEPYLTFKLDCGSFQMIGAAFKAETADFLRANVGGKVWLKGPMNPQKVMKDGVEKTYGRFTAIHFKATAEAAAPAAEEVAA
jgi:hypothetical protein